MAVAGRVRTVQRRRQLDREGVLVTVVVVVVVGSENGDGVEGF